MSKRFRFIFLIGASLLAAACSAAPEDAEQSDIDWDLDTSTMDRPIGANGLNPVDFWAPANQQALRSLGAGALLNRKRALVPTALLDTAGGRSVLAYAVRCAVAGGDSVEGGAYTLDGQLGLAPAWASRGLTTSEQRWMTACLLQHLNAFGANVAMMLLGNHPALDSIPGSNGSDFTIPDATAYGNLFASSPTAYLCANLGLELGCGLSWSSDTLARLCGLSPTCGLTVHGLCALSCFYDEEGDPTCSGLQGSSYPEAIATRVAQTGFLSVYPLCDVP